jgi:hypothetical protein
MPERPGYVVVGGIRVGALPQGFSVLDGQRSIHVFYATSSAHLRFLPDPWEGRFTLFRNRSGDGRETRRSDARLGNLRGRRHRAS